MQIIDGKKLAEEIKNNIKKEIKKLGSKPGLATILVGSDPSSHLYVKLKQRACDEVGIHNEVYLYFASSEEETIIEQIKKLNKRGDIHGILVQLPLPEHLNENKIIKSIDPKKDVDGFHPENIQKFLDKKPYITPGLAWGILKLIESTGKNLTDKKAVILCNSDTFAAPIEKILQDKNVITEHIHPENPNLNKKTKSADILIVAIGCPNFINKAMVKNGAIIIDVGTNRTEEGVVGDVDFKSVKKMDGFITPVPGGVGPMTIAMLLKNTLEIAKKQN